MLDTALAGFGRFILQMLFDSLSDSSANIRPQSAEVFAGFWSESYLITHSGYIIARNGQSSSEK